MTKMIKRGKKTILSKRVIFTIAPEDVMTFALNEMHAFPLMTETHKLMCDILKRPYSRDKERYALCKTECLAYRTLDMTKLESLIPIYNMSDDSSQINGVNRMFKDQFLMLDLELNTSSDGKMWFSDDIYVTQHDRVGEIVKVYDEPLVCKGLSKFKFVEPLTEDISMEEKLNRYKDLKIESIPEEMKTYSIMDNGVALLGLERYWKMIIRMIQSASMTFKFDEDNRAKVLREPENKDEIIKELMHKVCPKRIIGRDSITDRSKMRIKELLVRESMSIHTLIGLDEAYFNIIKDTDESRNEYFKESNTNTLYVVFRCGKYSVGFGCGSAKVSDVHGEKLSEIDIFRLFNLRTANLAIGSKYANEIDMHIAELQRESELSRMKAFGEIGNLMSSFGNPDGNDDEGGLLN